MAQEKWFTQFMRSITAWAKEERTIQCVLLVGSYARGTNHISSDIDLLLLTTAKPFFLQQLDFIHQFGKVSHYQIEEYGACTSIRVWYKDGQEVEYGLVTPSWLKLPLDHGTWSVLQDGYQVILDKTGFFTNFDLTV